MKFLLSSGIVLLAGMTVLAATNDVFVGRFTTEENGEFAVLTLELEGSGYAGTILMDGKATPVIAKPQRKALRGELRERDGRIYPFVARLSGIYLIMEFDDGAMIVFRRDEDDENERNER